MACLIACPSKGHALRKNLSRNLILSMPKDGYFALQKLPSAGASLLTPFSCSKLLLQTLSACIFSIKYSIIVTQK